MDRLNSYKEGAIPFPVGTGVSPSESPMEKKPGEEGRPTKSCESEVSVAHTVSEKGRLNQLGWWRGRRKARYQLTSDFCREKGRLNQLGWWRGRRKPRK